MLTFCVILYFIVASIGIYLFTKLFSGKPPKMLVGVIHGALGLSGIALLIAYTSFQQGDTPVISILCFVMALFFGGGMISTTMSGKKFPRAIAFIHIAIALTGIFFLIRYWLH